MSFISFDRLDSPRININLAVRLRAGLDVEDLETVEVSLGGVFLGTKNDFQLRQLVQMNITLPSNDDLEMNGMVVRRVSQETSGGVVPGIGIQFYGLHERVEDCWYEFIEEQLKESSQSLIDEVEEDDVDEEDEVDEEESGRSTLLNYPPLREEMSADSIDHTVEELARAAGLDPTIVAAALANEEEVDTEKRKAEQAHQQALSMPASALIQRRDKGESDLLVEPSSNNEQRDDETVKSVIHIISQEEPDEVPEQVSDETPDIVDDPPIIEGSMRDTQQFTDEEIQAIVGKDRPSNQPNEDEHLVVPVNSPHVLLEPDQQVVVRSDGRCECEDPLAPTGLLPNVVYQISHNSIESLEQFGDTVLSSGGVVIQTDENPPMGSPAVVCVVHPKSHDEFHIPGAITYSEGYCSGVGVRFAPVTERTMSDFLNFIARGLPVEEPPGGGVGTGLTMMNPGDRNRVNQPPKDTQSIRWSEVKPLKKTQ